MLYCNKKIKHVVGLLLQRKLTGKVRISVRPGKVKEFKFSTKSGSLRINCVSQGNAVLTTWNLYPVSISTNL